MLKMKKLMLKVVKFITDVSRTAFRFKLVKFKNSIFFFTFIASLVENKF